MIGPRTGLRIGNVVGPAVGVSADELGGTANPMAGVAQDATSGIYCPANASQWTTVVNLAIPARGNPISTWLMGEAATPLADSVGSNNLTVAGTTPLFQQSVPGWSRKGYGQGGNNNHAWGTLGSPDASATSVALLMYCYANTNAVARGMTQISASATRCCMLITSSLAVIDCAAVTTNSVNTHLGAHPWLMVYDRTHSTVKFYSDLEKLSGTYSAAVTSGQSGSGANGTQSGNATAVQFYGAEWSGAAAEFTDADAKALLQRLGWTIPWT